ncbi:MAG: hypothetical protein LBC61_06405 [Candidatus Peribacteria bacterium]|nr:hypothetical protein [Candidatus Peribacteria bacterium]
MEADNKIVSSFLLTSNNFSKMFLLNFVSYHSKNSLLNFSKSFFFSHFINFFVTSILKSFLNNMFRE